MGLVTKKERKDGRDKGYKIHKNPFKINEDISQMLSHLCNTIMCPEQRFLHESKSSHFTIIISNWALKVDMASRFPRLEFTSL